MLVALAATMVLPELKGKKLMYVSFFAININYSVINTKNKKMCCSCFGLELLISL